MYDLMHQLQIDFRPLFGGFEMTRVEARQSWQRRVIFFPFKQNYVRGSAVYLRRFPVQSS